MKNKKEFVDEQNLSVKVSQEKRLLSSFRYVAILVLALLIFMPLTFAAQLPVDLGTAEDFVILTKSGISTTGTTSIVGDIGVSPIDSTAITGFGLIMDSSGEFSTSTLVDGNIYASDYAEPTPTKLTTAVSDMETAYTDAAGRTTPDTTELGAGDISGLTISPGLHKWSTNVMADGTGFTLSGSPTDIWIFQIEGDLTLASGAIVTLEGGAVSKNIFWQVAGPVGVTLNTTSHMEGTLLSAKQIVVKTDATLNGRALAQTQVTLESNTIVLDEDAPTIIDVSTIGFSSANNDTFYGVDQNINIRLIANDGVSGVKSLDVNFYDINGHNAWVSATKIDVNNYYINTGNDWNHNFESVTLKVRVTDNAGNVTQSTDMNNSIVLNNSSYPTGFGGDTTNFNDINDFSDVNNFTFEKVGLGKIIFMSPVDLSDPAVLAILGDLNSAMTFRTGSTGNRIIGFETSGFSGALDGVDVNVTMYNLPFSTTPGLLHEGVRCDNNVAICSTSYVGGTFNFISKLGFSEYELDANAPILTDTTIPGGITTELSVSINELATCKYTSDTDLNYDTITDVNATSEDTSASWLLTDLNYETSYTNNVWCRDTAGNDSNLLITFTTNSPPITAVDLGTAEDFVILTKTGVSTTGTTSIVGNIGVSPIDSTAITGFGLIMDSSGEFSTSTLVDGNIYASDYTTPTPGNLTTVVSDMETAYTDAAGRTTPDYTELGAGDISGMTLYSGLYKWSTGVMINDGVTLNCQGDSNAVFIFQIGENLTVGDGAIVTLSNSCFAKNIFWQVAGQTTLGTTTIFNGTILSQTKIVLNNGGTLNGKALSQTAVTLIGNSVNDSDGEIDTTSPSIDINQTIPSTTIINDTNAVIDVNSDERVTCKYSINTDMEYSSMLDGSTFDSNGTITVTDLVGGTDYNLYVRCRDMAGNDSNVAVFSFTTLADNTNPIISLSDLIKSTTTAQATVHTNEFVTCRRSTTDLNYDLMNQDGNVTITTTDGNGSGIVGLSGLNSSTAYTMYVVCRDSNNNDANESISFTTNTVPTDDDGGSSGGSSGGGSYYYPTCTDFVYSEWSTCSSDGEQTRTIVSKTPTNCVNGTRVLSQECNFVPIETTPDPVDPVDPIDEPTDDTGLINWYTPGTAEYYEKQRVNQELLGLPLTYPLEPSEPTDPKPAIVTGLFTGWFGLGELANTIVPLLIVLLMIGVVIIGALIGYKALHERKAEQEQQEKLKREEKLKNK